ncbi:hypothetical protein A3A60_02395 [Candidatus Curtissbacteria bacterium RIFCSPLOWO2_01_FULL_42_26]|uniref:Uncharacterized protein n=1 Tax=Candidatus Curtissbacteria bacterium RIFCSPLOWO2_01_FULL_42_26 TaxID=1797729 RepID=A0A1F5I3D4_9BACT|nr:MAG: hypothetical protein A3A60_02395 [Candidatus Curtissbacteria bacterium RIFCSPLOWO2_01_FULL_42_26]
MVKAAPIYSKALIQAVVDRLLVTLNTTIVKKKYAANLIRKDSAIIICAGEKKLAAKIVLASDQRVNRIAKYAIFDGTFKDFFEKNQ